MNSLPSKPIPKDYQRIVLINPTKFIGNLLIAGDLILQFYKFCESQNKSLLLVVDERFELLLENIFPTQSIIFYPRARLQGNNHKDSIQAYLQCLHKIRSFKADIAFNIEEDTAAKRLTQFSGAKFKLGCSQYRHHRGYDHVLPVNFEQRSKGEKHRWYSYYEVFAAFGMPKPNIKYLPLAPKLLSIELQTRLMSQGLDFDLPIVVLHPGTSKAYKQWPLINFVTLAKGLLDNGIQVVFIGNGEHDRSANRAIMQALMKLTTSKQAVDLIDYFTLSELSSFLVLSSAIVSSDSGPFHLAAALKVPGCVIFGPSNPNIWSPLFTGSQVLSGKDSCSPECSRNQCEHFYRCLNAVNPTMVLTKLGSILDI